MLYYEELVKFTSLFPSKETIKFIPFFSSYNLFLIEFLIFQLHIMSASATLFVAMPFDEFQELIQSTIKNELRNFSIIPQQVQKDELLSIEEAGALLHVSKVTIHKWKRNKLIQAYRIGRKIYFKRQELIDAIKAGISLKRKQ